MGWGNRASHGFEALWNAGMELRVPGPPEGFLQQTTLRTRVIAAVLAVFASISTDSFALLLAIYFISAAAALFSLIDIQKYMLRNLAVVGLFVLPMSIFGVFQFVTPGAVIMHVGPAAVTLQGVKSVMFVVLRSLCAVSVLALLVRSAGIGGVIRGLRDCGVPASVVAALQIAVAHVHVLGRTANAMVLGLRSRTVQPLPVRKAWSAMATQGAVLFQKSMSNSSQLHAAMLARGFAGQFPLVDLQRAPEFRDYLVLGAAAILLLAGLFL